MIKIATGKGKDISSYNVLDKIYSPQCDNR